jgi:hypothetical protein
VHSPASVTELLATGQERHCMSIRFAELAAQPER